MLLHFFKVMASITTMYILNMRPGCHTLLNACVMSRNAAEQYCFFLSSSYYPCKSVYLFYGKVFLSKFKLMIWDDSVFF
jgi:hypothetical protein